MDSFLQHLSLLHLGESPCESDVKKLNDNFLDTLYLEDLEEFYQTLEKSNYDLIVIDIDDFNKDKYNIINYIKNQNIFSFIFCISKNTDHKILIELIDLDISGYLEKPFDSISFLAKVERLKEKYTVYEEYQINQKNLSLLQQYQKITDNSSVISKTDKKGIITYANDNFCEISGYNRDELVGKRHNLIRHPDTKKELFKELWDTAKNKKQLWSGILKNLAKDGSTYYVKTTVAPILDKNGDIIEFIALRHNITSILSDKQHFLDTVNSNILSLLVLVQINGFDMLEKFYNLTTIDSIEKMFGFKLAEYFPKEFSFNHIFHLENGRYALVSRLEDFMISQVKLEEYLREFENNVKKTPLEIDGIEYDISVSLSYSLGKHMLYEDAKAGLEEAVNKNVTLFKANDCSLQHQVEAKRNLEVIKMVKTALENYKVVSYFQPIINNQTQKIEKYESLVRLVSEDGRIISPYEFLHISKKGTYYNRITQRVLDNSFNILHMIQTKLSINLSALDIEKEETRNYIYKLLDDYKDDTQRLIFELLEDENVKDFNSIREFVKRVKSMGVSIAIDDFGAGYSNFERLMAFDPDIIKIDGSLIRDILENDYNKSVVETIVTFAKKQNISVVAEFVETKEIFEYLKSIGVDYSQGYYFGKPLASIL